MLEIATTPELDNLRTPIQPPMPFVTSRRFGNSRKLGALSVQPRPDERDHARAN